MKIRKEHQWILLESSGELSRFKQRRLHRALERDPELKRYAEEIRELEALEQNTAPIPPPFSTSQIEYQARRRQQHSPHADFLTLWQPALAYGAIALALGMSIIYLSRNWEGTGPTLAQRPPEAGVLDWEDPYLDALEELNLQLANLEEVHEHPEMEENWIMDELDSLARDLLKLGESS